MMHYLFAILFLLPSLLTRAQVSLQTVPDRITANNLQVKASSENRDARIVFARTGLTPADPQVEYGYFSGNNEVLGNKTRPLPCLGKRLLSRNDQSDAVWVVDR